MTDRIRSLTAAASCAFVLMSVPAAAQNWNNSQGAELINKLLGTGQRWAPVATFTVAGVKLGMSPDEARAALRTAGFTPRAEDPMQDAWAAVVSQKVAERIGGKVDQSKVPMFTVAEGPQGERVEVWYAATPEGAKATQIKYQMPTSRMEKASFLSGVASKYGRGTVDEGNRRLYCTRGEASCVTYGNKTLPYMDVETSYAVHVIDLKTGGRYSDDLKAQRAAAIEAGAPKNAKASF